MRAGLTPAIRIFTGLLGIATFGAGVAAVFVTDNGTGAAALLAIGAGFLVFAVLGDRIQSLQLGSVNLTIRDMARQTFAMAENAERRGDEATAQRMRTVGKELEALARGYRRLRRGMRSSAERTRALEHVVREARELAKRDVFEPDDVATWFEEGTPEARITALGLMQGNPRLRDFEAALDAIADSRSAFEMYHGLRLAQMMLADGLSDTQRAQLRVVLERPRTGRLTRGSDRRPMVEQMLAELRSGK